MKPLLTLLTLLTLASLASAQQPPKPDPWRFVDASTLAVARLDLSTYDRPAAEQWLTTLIKTNADPHDADDITLNFSQGPLSFPDKLKQAGAKELFAVLTLANLPANPGWIVIPVPQGASADQIARAFFDAVDAKPDPAPAAPQPNQPLLRSGSLFAITIDNTLLISAGDPAPLQHFTPANRSDLTASFDRAGSAPIILAFSPTDDTRKVIEQMLPTLPPPASVPSTVLTHGLRSAALSITFPPKPILNLTIQSDNAPAAGDLHTLITKILAIARQDPGFHKAFSDSDQIIDAITPKLDTDHLTLSLDTSSTEKVVAVLAPTFARARENANRVKSASNLRQIGQGLLMYANEHKGAYPDSLDQIVQYFQAPGGSNLFKQVMQNPRSPSRPTPYLYLKPSADSKTISPETVVAYESFDPNHWPDGINALFGDGHTEFIPSQLYFTQLLNKSKSPK